MKQLLANFKAHAPLYVAGALVVINALIDAGFINLPAGPVDLINAVLAATGLGVLHVRQTKG